MHAVLTAILEYADNCSDLDDCNSEPDDIFNDILAIVKGYAEEPGYDDIDIHLSSGDASYIRIGNAVYPEQYVHFEIDPDALSIKVEYKLKKHPDGGMVVGCEDMFELWEVLDDFMDFLP